MASTKGYERKRGVRNDNSIWALSSGELRAIPEMGKTGQSRSREEDRDLRFGQVEFEGSTRHDS